MLCIRYERTDYTFRYERTDYSCVDPHEQHANNQFMYFCDRPLYLLILITFI